MGREIFLMKKVFFEFGNFPMEKGKIGKIGQSWKGVERGADQSWGDWAISELRGVN